MTPEAEEKFILSSIRHGDSDDFFHGRSIAFDFSDEDWVLTFFIRTKGKLITSVEEAMRGWRYQRDILDAAEMLAN